MKEVKGHRKSARTTGQDNMKNAQDKFKNYWSREQEEYMVLSD